MFPVRIKIGKVPFTVLQPIRCAPNVAGMIYYQHRVIEVAHYVNKRKRTKLQRTETFWHEITHGILADMGHPLATNEAFVTAFAKRLATTINSARF